jgi:hypothetical protein
MQQGKMYQYAQGKGRKEIFQRNVKSLREDITRQLRKKMTDITT